MPKIVQAAAGERIVRLPNGSIYRGELVELVPDDHITIRLATGAVKRFDWASITRVSRPLQRRRGHLHPLLHLSQDRFLPGWKADLPSNSNQTVVQIESENEGVALNQITTSIGHVIGTGAVGSIYAWEAALQNTVVWLLSVTLSTSLAAMELHRQGVLCPNHPAHIVGKGGSLRFRSSGLMLYDLWGIAVIGGLSSLIMIPIFSSTDTAGFKHDNSGYLIGAAWQLASGRFC